jgi:serine/threonine protein kinase
VTEASFTTIRQICPKCLQQYDCARTQDAARCPEDGEKLLPLETGGLTSKTVADKYLVGELIGEGGWAVVYSATHLELKRLVALKVLRQEISNDLDRLDRFKQEATAVSSLCHPNICQVYDFGLLQTRQPYLVLEYIQGERLSDRIKRLGRLPLVEAMTIFRQAADALSAAHALGIVHRDLKPGNMMLVEKPDGQLQLKIIDFGLVKIVREDQGLKDLTATGQTVGTPAYMSPEQCMASNTLDARTDIYALGCVVYELITGKMVFEADSAFEVMGKQLNDEPASFSKAAPDVAVPRAIEDLVMHCLEKLPENRPQTMQEVIEAINETVASGNLRVKAKPRRRRRRLRRGTVAIAAASIGIVGGAAWLWIANPMAVKSPQTEPSGKIASSQPAGAGATSTSPGAQPARYPFIMGRFAADAEANFSDRVHKLEASNQNSDSWDLALARWQLGTAELSLNKYKEAKTLYDKVLAYANNHFKKNDDRRVKVLIETGFLYWRLGDTKKADKYLMEASDLESNKEPDQTTGPLLGLISQIFTDMGEVDNAVTVANQGLRHARAVLGDKNPNFAPICRNHALVLERAGKIEQANGCYKHSVDTLAETLGPEHPASKALAAEYQAFRKRHHITNKE